VRTLAQVVSGAVAQRRFQLVILLCFAVTALATAGVGIYGIMAHSLVQRANEIGIRMALGAGTGDIYRLALVEGLVPAGAGLGAGILASMGLSRALRSLLFEVQPGDPMTIASVAVVLTLLAALASLVPALRAARADPMEALRVE
jgi:ABC-type antimicrobial peptide transport system permease subunit